MYEYFKNSNLSNEVGYSNFEISDINFANDTLNGVIIEEEITSSKKKKIKKMTKHLDMIASLMNILNLLLVYVWHYI